MRLVLAFAALFVLGLAGAGYVIATAPEQAAGSQTLELSAVDAPEDARVTAFENLSDDDRRLVSSAVRGNGSARIDPGQRPNASHIRYEGSVYRLRVVVGDPAEGTTLAHLVAVVTGGAAAVVGALGLVGALFQAWRRERDRTQ
ncbi:hypothetical protein [Halorientalis regularis]|uniref:DUF7979 domain-containing protein n=1 Tax=Halorientalis regularis TaxID=660518 RepID=A0A1G7PFB3_9EURY|nr:hypothetical protein [Halorientalis regularis]SDF84923.1 hypothetical protein SAMN05216218_11098 [Halorientalis regularis]